MRMPWSGSELFMEITKRQLRYLEIPIKTIYSDYSKRKGQPMSNGLNILIRLLLRGIGGPL